MKENKNNEEGYLYCIYNKMYDVYGDNIYKLGNMKSMRRMNSYVTPYLDPIEIKLVSNKIVDKNMGEKILFDILNKYRCKPNREFFNCDLEIIKKAIEDVELIFKNKPIEKLQELYGSISREQKINNMISLIDDNLGKDNENHSNASDSDDISSDITSDDINEINDEITNLNNDLMDNQINNKIYSKYKNKNEELQNKLKIQLTPEIIKKWYRKEYIVDNTLCALGKMDYGDDSNMDKKIGYLKKFLNVFSFDSLLDKKTVELDETLRTKMRSSGLLIRQNYLTIMKTFEKQERANDCENFRESTFIKIANCILNEFGFKLDNIIEKKRNKQIKNKFDRKYFYFLKESMPCIIEILDKY